MFDRSQVHEGMTVRSADGKKLGRVLACEQEGFIVEKGCFFATDYVARYGDVEDVSGEEVRISRREQALAHGEHAVAREGGLGESFTVGLAGGLDTSPRAPWAMAEDEEQEIRGGAVRGDEREDDTSYNLGEDSGALPPSYGEEGGGGP